MCTDFQTSFKIFGFSNQIVIADDSTIKGKFALVECGTIIPSHCALSGFSKSYGFPTNEHGDTMNDRDYEHDLDAQKITRQIAANYDSRAIQSPIIVSFEGIVYSGNGRAMAGQLAAVNGTDQAYIEYLQTYCEQYGFNRKVLSQFSHPRIVFVVNKDSTLPYTTETFARFNSQEMKGQNKTEKAIKLGKLIDDTTYHRIISSINLFDTLGEFYADKEASLGALQELQKAGAISSMEWPQMIDVDVISEDGKNLLENVLIGKSFVTDANAVRKISSHKFIRKAIISALVEISNNSTLGEFALEKELTEAVNLTVDALNAGYRPGDTVSAFARQVGLFSGETVTDYRDELVGIIANTLNSKKTTLLKKIYRTYNQEAKQSAAGQTDLFSEDQVRSRDEILRDCAIAFRIKGAKAQKDDSFKNGAEQIKRLSEIFRKIYNIQNNISN